MKGKKSITVFAKKALVLLLALIFIMPYVPASKVYAAYVLGTYKVTASSLTIRSGPDTTYSALGYLSNGDTVTITEIQNEKWGKFTKDGITGWSSMAYMELIEEGTSTSIAVGDQITINAGATSYGTTTAFASFVYSNVYVVISISGDRVVFGPDSSSVTGAVALSDITKVGTKNYYAAGENKIYAKGIDVSKWQETINWSSVAADGVDFAILRAAVTVSPGASVGKDSYFETNYTNAKAAGIDVGVYMYGCAITTDQAIAEADGLYNIIKGKQFEYPIYYDVEYEDQKTVGKTAMANVIMAFIRRMESYGYYVGTYSGEYMLNSCIDTSIIGENNDIWMAKYYNALMNMTPSDAYSKVSSYTSQYSALYGMWQWSSTSSINGISGNVDVDVAYKDYPTIIKSKGLNGFSATTPTAATPTISSSNTTGGKNVTIACSTSGATIYYTTDGSTPTTSSTKYTSAFKVTSSTTVKAIAVASGYNNSSVASSTISVSQTATPTITAANTTGGKNVTIACSTSGATIYYTTDGSTPTTSSTKYTAAFKVTSSTTVKALAVTSGYTNSAVASSTVSVSQTATPTITAANTTGGKNVTIACSTSGATVYYTTDGSAPTTSSTKYTAAFTVTADSTTIKALAVTSGYTNSAVASSTVTVSQVSTPVITIDSSKNVTITCSTSSATVYYTTDGTTPTTSSNVYSSAFKLTTNGATVKAIAVASGYRNSSVASKTAEITKADKPVIAYTDYVGGKYVAFSSTTEGATIYYTTDGTDPTTESKVYTSKFKLSAASYTIKAIAVADGYYDSDIMVETLEIPRVEAPVIAIDGAKNVTITCSTADAAIYYTIDGTNPTTTSNAYEGTFTLASNGITVKAYAVLKGYRNSSVTSMLAETTKADKPVIAYTDYVGGKYVALSTNTAGATIYYTTDGTDPTTTSKIYTSKFKLSGASYIIKAIAVAEGYYDSDIMEETLEIPRVETPVITIGQNNGVITVSISCDTGDSIIYYTTDGTTPSTTSTQYEGIFTIEQEATVSAIATKSGYRNSAKATATYTVLPELVVIDKTDVSINKEETVQLSATVTPDNAKNKAVTWSSSNTAVATVSESGLVTGVADGNATITATTSNGLTATCTVTVIDDSGVYALITSPDYLIHGTRLAIIYNNTVVGKVSSSTMITSDATVSNGIASNIENEDTWIIEQSGTKYYLKNTVTGKYLGLSSSTSVNTSDTAQAFDIALQSDGTFLITHVESGRYLGYNGSTGFKLYTTGYMNTHPGYVNIYVYNTSGNLPDSKLYTAQALTDGHGTATNTAEGVSYISGTQVTFTATPNDGYEFNAWVDEKGNTVSTDAQYTFSLTSDTVYTATFTQLSCGAVTATPDGGVIKTGSTITLSAASGEKIMYSINGGEFVEYKSAITASELPMSISAYTTRDNYINGTVSQFSYTASGVFALIQDSSYIESATENTKFALIYNGAYIGKISSGTALSTAITISNNIITDVNDITSYNIEKNGNYYYIKNSSTGKYLALTTTANSANVVNSDTPAAFNIIRQLDGTFIFVHVESGRYLGYNGSTGFKLYTYSDSNLTKYCGKINVYLYTEDEIPTVNALSSVTICSGGNGTVTPIYTSESIVNGTTLELNAVADSGYVFNSWTDSNGKTVSNNASFTLTVSTTETYIATFTQLVCGKVVASPGSGEITSGTLITLTTDYDADIMYSINGSDYIKYTGPFSADVFPLTLSAYATKQNYGTGEVSTYNYTKPVLEDGFNGTFVKAGTLSSISNDSLYIIAVNGKAISSALSSSALTPVDVAASGNKITTDNSSIVWVIQATETDGVYKLMTSDKKYLNGSSSSSNVSLNTTGIEVTITANGDGTFTINQNNDSGYYLGYNTSTNVFKWYKSTASTYASALSIYKYDKSAQAVQYYTLNVSTDGNGDLATDMSGTYAENTSITVTAVEHSNSTFDGWYNSNGDLLCDDAQYSFTMIEDVTCIAKFIILTVGDADGNGKIDATDTQVILDYLVNLSSISEKFMEFADYNDDGKVNLLDAYLICLAIINN